MPDLRTVVHVAFFFFSKESGLYAIKRLSRDRGKAAFVSLAPFCDQRERYWCTQTPSLLPVSHVPLQIKL